MAPMTYPANTDIELQGGGPESGDWAAEAEARVLAQALKLAPEQGWTWAMTKAAGAAAGFSLGETELLLPGGPRDLAALHSRACDAATMAALAGVDPTLLKIRERMRRGAMARTDAAMASEAATRRWAGFLALPGNATLGLRLVWESADAIWCWAGDTSTDENHYSKRALLAGILMATLLVRLSQGEAAAAATLARRIEAVMAFERFKGRVGKLQLGAWTAGAMGRLRYGLRL
jgi:ubiquinone biosynthesis protein COQ9